MNYLLFISRAPALDKQAFGASLLESAASLAPCVVHLTDVNPPWPVDPLMGELTAIPSYDAMIEWRRDDAGELLKFSAGFQCLRAHLYRVTKIIDKQPTARMPVTTRTMQLSFWRAHAGLTPAAVMSAWHAHMPLALRVQGGALSYARYVIEAPLTSDTPPLSGVSCLSFTSEADLVMNQYDSPEAAYALLEDSSYFMAEESLVYASEWPIGLDVDGRSAALEVHAP